VDITFQIDEAYAANIDQARLEEALAATFNLFPPPFTGTLAVAITNNQTVQNLNRLYRGVDAPTDVLSFEGEFDPDFPGETVEQHLGDIIIAYPVAQKQAAAMGHSPLAEVILLTVHGALHLLGYNHDTADNKQTMWAAQQKIMAALGLAQIQPTET
jgi:probable rRNA maturation factor